MRKGETLPEELRNQFTKKTMPDAMPREQLRRAPNPRLVSDEDLIAILLRTGSHGCNVKELARRLIAVFGSLKALITSDWRTIENRVKEYNKQNPDNRIKGFGPVKCLELSAAFELGYRRQRLSPDDIHGLKVRTPEDAYKIFRVYFAADDEQENVFVLPLDADRRPICEPFLVSRGTIDGVIMHPREIFKHAIRWGANSIVVAHNHPCGNPTPGPRDIAQTKSLLDVAEIVGVRLFDHIVLGGESFVSIRSLAMLPFAGERHLFIERDNHQE